MSCLDNEDCLALSDNIVLLEIAQCVKCNDDVDTGHHMYCIVFRFESVLKTR